MEKTVDAGAAAHDGRSPRRGQIPAVALVAALLLAAVVAAAVIVLRSGQDGLQLLGPEWDCSGTQLVGGDPHDPFHGEQPAPALDPDMECWATYLVIGTPSRRVTLDELAFDLAGLGSGAAFRITAARVDGQERAVRGAGPVGGPRADVRVQVPVGRDLHPGESVPLSVLVTWGEGCTAPGTRLRVPPSVRTTLFWVPRTTTWSGQRAASGEPAGPQPELAVVGTPASSCEE